MMLLMQQLKNSQAVAAQSNRDQLDRQISDGRTEDLKKSVNGSIQTPQPLLGNLFNKKKK